MSIKLKDTIMLKKIFSTVLITIFCSIAMQTIYAQGIGINETGAAPDSSAILDVSSSNKVFYHQD